VTRWSFAEIFGSKKTKSPGRYSRDPVLSRFCTVPACDRRTDTRWQHIPC